MAENLTYTKCGDYYIPDIRIDRNKHEVDIHEGGTVYIDGVLQENKRRKSADYV